VYEKNLKVFPSFCVVPGSAEVSDWHMLVGINMKQLLQLSHEIELYGPIPPSGTLYTTTIYNPVYDLGDSGALIHMTVETTDEEGTLLFINRCTLLDRSAGNFCGEQAPQLQPKNPPNGQAPDFQVEYSTSHNQAALYRLSGDKNLMHIDPDFAHSGGFNRSILHGLCTFGFSCRAVLHQLCQGDPPRLRFFSANFVGVVYPGETLITQGWCIEKNEYIIQTKTEDGRLVMDNGSAVII
jgi:acyl dehydratase